MRYDGAAYLAGYVVECAIKSVLVAMLSGTRPPLANALPHAWRHHRLRDLSADALKLAQQTMSGSHLPYLPAAVAMTWTETLRYRSPSVPENQAQDWVAEAERTYLLSVGTMRLHGVVS